MNCEGENGESNFINEKYQAALVFCMDSRFRKDVNDFVRGKIGGSFFPIFGKGGVQSINLQKKESENLAEIKLAVVYHGVKYVILVNHEDCDDYGGSVRFGDLQMEEEFHEEELRKAERFLSQNLPGIHIAAFYAKKIGGETVLDEV